MRNLKSPHWLSRIFSTLVILFIGMVSTHAATINVAANATDTLNGTDAQCSLREAITNINDGASTYADCVVTGASYGTGDTINIPAGTYTTTTSSYNIAKNVSIVGAGAGTTTINGNSLDRVFVVGAYTVSLSGVTITGGVVGNYGGGIFNQGTLTIADSIVSGNTSNFEGGGIYTTGATLHVINSTISGNTAYKAGGIFNWASTVTITHSTISGNTSSESQQAGGIFSYGWLTVTHSTISGNVGVRGGGIGNYGVLTVTNSTISGNSASTGGGIANIWNGGGIPMTVTVTNSTISGNSAGTGGGVYQDGSYTATLSNTIVANQTSGADCAGAITSAGHNLESGTSCGFTSAGDLQNTNPLLSALASNGGLTQTMALQTGSPAMDVGDNAICAAAPVNGVDQRNYSRPSGARCDIGAYEAAASCVTPPRFGLSALWSGENNANDSAGTNTGTPINGVTYSAGHAGNAFDLNGTNQTIAVPDGIIPNTARNFTVGAWVNSNSVAGSHWIFYGGANVGEYHLYMAEGGHFSFSVNLAGSGGQSVASPVPSSTGTWYYVAGVRRGTSIEIWVNGVLMASAPIPDENLQYASWNPTGFPSRIGAYHHDVNGDSYLWNGKVDEVTLYNRALSASELAWTYRGTCDATDTVPNAFTFSAQTGAALSTAITSNTITVAGINSASAISIAGGTYSINGGAYTAAAGTVNNGDTLTVRLTSSANFNTLTTATLTIGGVSAAFDVITSAQDTTPVQFSFAPVNGAPRSELIISEAVSVSGTNAPVSISISNGEYQINGGLWTTSAGTVNPADAVRVRLTTSASPVAVSTASLAIGGVNGAFTVTTSAQNASTVVLGSATWPGNGHTYHLIASSSKAGNMFDGITWTDAESYAANTLHGHLASVDSQQVNDWLWNTYGANAGINMWIGLTDQVVEGQFKWIAGGQPAQFTNWYQGEPNNYNNEDHVFILHSSFTGGNGAGPGKWNDAFAGTTAFLSSAYPVYAIVETVTGLYNNDFELDPNGAAPPLVTGWHSDFYTTNDAGVRGTPAYPNHDLHVSTTRSFSGAKSISSYIRNTAGNSGGDPTTRHSTQELINNLPVTTQSDTLYLWRSDVAYTTASRYYWRLDVELSDGTTTSGVELACRAWGNSEGCTNNFQDTHDQQATGTDGQIWYRHAIPVPAGMDRTNLSLKIRHQQDSWDGGSAESTIYYDLMTDLGRDNTPYPFSFAAQVGVSPSSSAISNPMTVSGINSATAISITGGEYQINNGSWLSTPGTVNSGDTVTVRQTSTASLATKTDAVLTIGGVSGAFSITTIEACTPPPSGMVSWWGGDNNALDMVGTNNGTLHGATYATGKVGQALNFDGGSSYVEVQRTSNNFDLGTGDFAVEGWIYPRAAGDRPIISRWDGDNGFAWDLRLGWPSGGGANDALYFFMVDGGGGLKISDSITLNQWHHIAAVRRNGVMYGYVDGVEYNAGAQTRNASNPNARLFIGKFPGYSNPSFDGMIDEFAFFNRALSASEIAAAYSADSMGVCRNSAPLPSGVIASWKGENNANDSIGANNGAMMNGATFVAGKVGQAFSLDGVDGYVDMGNSDAFNFGSGDFAISFWAKPKNGGGGDDYDHVIGKAAATSFAPFVIGVHNSKWKFWSTSNGSSWDIALDYIFGDIALNSWQYIVVARTGNAINFYINGVQTATITTASGLWSNTEHLLVGKIPWTAQDTHFNGLVDEIQIFNRALTATEVATIYNAGDAGTALTRTVIPGTGANGSISPSTPLAATIGSSASFTVTPDMGYAASVGGTCGGTLVGTTYTTNVISAGCTVTASFGLNTATIFSYTGSDQIFTVPAGVTEVMIKTWGAGGGGGSATAGGAGGYASGTLSVTPGQQLTVIVGEGGTSFSGASPAPTYGGGGGLQGLGGTKGGGRSAVRDTSIAELITAGGGGGGSNSASYDGSTGGAGGGISGGYSSAACGQSGGGASQSAGGCASQFWGATAGAAFQGGVGSSAGGVTHASSGGGGGYYGGGGANIGAGGGGSGYIGGVTGGILTAGSGATPPNIADTEYLAGVGVGGAANGGAGGNGRITILYAPFTGDTTGANGQENIAKNKTVTALTDTARGTPQDAVDGDIATEWYSYQGNPTSNIFTVDLGASYTMGRINLYPVQTQTFALSTSADGNIWIERYRGPVTQAWPILLDAKGTYSARYIKYEGSANWPQYVGMAEVEVLKWMFNQTVSFGAAPTLAVGGTGPVSATATSGLPVSFYSLTPAVCSVNGNTITGILAGTCTIAADQAGDGSYSAATQVTQSITVTGANTAPGFASTDGRVITAIGSGNDSGQGLAIQTDGKILVAGFSYNGSNDDFALVRYNTDGNLDTRFGSNGKVTTAVGAGNDQGLGIALQADGKILVAGVSQNGLDQDFALARYNTDGSLDSGFGANGITTTNFVGGLRDYGHSVTVQADGKILVAGVTYENQYRHIALARYNTDGSPDTGFSGDGKLNTNFTNTDAGFGVTVQTDGKILVGGESYNGVNLDFSVVRYNTDGSLDTGFNATGQASTDFNASTDQGFGIALQANGQILVTGVAWNNGTADFALARYNANGSLDSNFNHGGKITTDLGGDDFAQSVTVQTDGKILVAGYREINFMDVFALVRYTPEGSLDTSFGTGGMVITEVGDNAYSNSVKVQGDGKIVVAGTSFDGSKNNFAVVRYNADGSLDTSFGVPHFTEGGAAILLAPGKRVVDAELAASGNYAGASLTLARSGGANAQDIFSSSGTLGALTQGGNLTVGGIIIGTVTTHSGGTLVLTFNSNATQNLVNSAMQQIAYSNNSSTPPASVQINWTLNDGNSGALGSGGALNGAGGTLVNITSLNPVVSLSASALSFGNQNVGSSSAVQTVTLSNTGNATLNIGNIVASGDFVVTHNCSASLAIAANCILNVTFTPTAAGTRSGTATIASDAAGSPHTVTLTGSGNAATAVTLTLAPSWNLVGNSNNAPLNVAIALGNPDKVTTVWKWVPATSKWAFYAPALAASGNLATYAASKGYDVLDTIGAGEGFWVNVKAGLTVQLPAGTAVTAVSLQGQSDPAQNKLLKGWNLISIDDNMAPSTFNYGLSHGAVPLNITTLWAWDNALSNWYFYAPNLEASGGLANYISTKGYLDFTAKGKMLGQGVGFWVNRP